MVKVGKALQVYWGARNEEDERIQKFLISHFTVFRAADKNEMYVDTLCPELLITLNSRSSNIHFEPEHRAYPMYLHKPSQCHSPWFDRNCVCACLHPYINLCLNLLPFGFLFVAVTSLGAVHAELAHPEPIPRYQGMLKIILNEF